MRQFPIMIDLKGTKGPCPSWIPWEAIAPYEGQAKVNHDQTLERLAQRGGLDPVEAFFVMTGRTWGGFPKMTDELEREACAFLDKIVRDRDAVRVERDAALLEVAGMKKLLADIHEAGRGLFLQLDPRGGVGERLSIVWDRLAPYARNRNDENLAPEIPFTQDQLKALQDSPFKGPDTPWPEKPKPETGGNPWAPNKDYPGKPIR